jgi:hypothetical protein
MDLWAQTLPQYVQKAEYQTNNDCSRESSPLNPPRSNSIFHKANMKLSCVFRLFARLNKIEDIWAEDGVQQEECLPSQWKP